MIEEKLEESLRDEIQKGFTECKSDEKNELDEKNSEVQEIV